MKRAITHSQVGICGVALLLLGGVSLSAGEPAKQAHVRSRAAAAKKKGNYRDALKGYEKLVLAPADEPKLAGQDLTNALDCLRRLGRLSESDALTEKAVKIHPKTWRLLFAAARHYVNTQHYGYVVAGKFHRGHHRGGGRYVNSSARDRVRSLQLMLQALPHVKDEADKHARFNFYHQFAMQMYRNGSQAWRLQYLTDLTELPDTERGYYHHRGSSGAPVDADGSPVYHKLPTTFEAAKTDGERWRWLMMMASEMGANYAPRIRFEFASFLRQQFGVQTMSYYGGLFRNMNSDDPKNRSNPFAVRFLKENETIARLASGVKRFEMPAEYDFVKILKELATAGAGYSNQAQRLLGRIFEDRQQYEKAANYYRQAGDQNKVRQIVGNWGQFEQLTTQPAGEGATINYRFRNGKKVTFKAHAIKVERLLADVKALIKKNPGRVDWYQLNLSNLGYRLVQKNQRQYLGEQVASWERVLEPRKHHFDKRVTIKTPLKKPGAYFLTAQMETGNISRIVVWVADTIIVRKDLADRAWLMVTDAATGKPLANTNIDAFGYRRRWVKRNTYRLESETASLTTDANGQATLSPRNTSLQWVFTCKTAEGRFAYQGFQGIWRRGYTDRWYERRKVFMITDRPVYRPDQKVKYKFWINTAKYDREGPSPFAGQNFNVRINNPKGEKAFEKSFKADEYGGFDGEFTITKDMPLGRYYVQIPGWGGGSFRVEEYKKPEFEVKIEAPKEPVMLGEKIAATINAKYYFGAPVTEAKVKYKVLRHTHSSVWYPTGIWDWFYQPGYWWFAYDYAWYPGWRKWGCMRPSPWWWGRRHQPPEVVLENEAEIGHDGTIKVEIDTALAKAMHGDSDHKYSITAEVTDKSRRTIVGAGDVLVARKPFKVYTWVDRGYYRVGDTVRASFSAQTLDRKPVKGKGLLRLLSITYDHKREPVETEVQKWEIGTNEDGKSHQQIKATKAGQYRLSYKLTDTKGHAMEGGYVFCVRGEGFDGSAFRFNDIELVADKREYANGDKLQLMINTNRIGGTVALFIRPVNSVYLPPKMIRLDGKSTVVPVEVLKKDMPNFFVEALTVSNGKIHTETREIVVPPESRILKVDVTPSAKEYKPGQKSKMKIMLKEMNGEPFRGSAVVSIYDKAVEYISGGSNVQEIKSFFWKWRRRHYPRTQSSIARATSHIHKHHEQRMGNLGVFGHLVADMAQGMEQKKMDAGKPGLGGGGRGSYGRRAAKGAAMEGAAGPAMTAAPKAMKAERALADKEANAAPAGAPQPVVQPTVRTKFADTAFWAAALDTGLNGTVEIDLTMPENLTTWKVKVWAMGAGTRVGQGEAEVVTSKKLLVRLQAPRFFTQKDEVVLSANVHNYLKTKKSVQVSLELDGPCLVPMGAHKKQAKGGYALPKTVEIAANGEARVDWRVKVAQPGKAIVRMKALSDEESDAMQMSFPAQVHGMLKTESFAGSIRPEKNSAVLAFSVPQERKADASRLEVRYSPTLAGAMVDALPYMVSYPYGCTEQTLNRFLPTVITQNVLMRMNIKLADVKNKITNLNAQEIGDDVDRARQWKRWKHNPVFDESEVRRMVKSGVDRLASMQVSDGGWGWFSGWGERSYPHTTAYVVHGLQIARQNDVAIPAPLLDRGVQWLKGYQAKQVRRLKNAPTKTHPYKTRADNLDAFTYMVLADAKTDHAEMREFLYRDRNHLAVYSKAMFGLALHKVGKIKQRDMLIQNVDQYLIQDNENDTAYLKLPQDNYWWYWYGSEYEAHAYYLKLLSATDPKGTKAPRIVKYLINNRKHGTYWKSTRDTAVCIEAMADFLKASGEDRPDMTLEIALNGRKLKEVAINASNLFTFDNALVLTGTSVPSGKHEISFNKKGTGPLYFNAYVTNFTMEDHIKKAGLEVKVERKYYKLKKIDKKEKVAGSRGQALDQKVEKYERTPLSTDATLKSGDLVEIELEIESKNDYEYIVFEDMKAAGFEPVEVRSGYNREGMHAYVEYRDERVVFFCRSLARGKHSVKYRVRAEIPGKFNALPTKISAMYAPELRGNSDEIRLNIVD